MVSVGVVRCWRLTQTMLMPSVTELSSTWVSRCTRKPSRTTRKQRISRIIHKRYSYLVVVYIRFCSPACDVYSNIGRDSPRAISMGCWSLIIASCSTLFFDDLYLVQNQTGWSTMVKVCCENNTLYFFSTSLGWRRTTKSTEIVKTVSKERLL